MFRLIGQVESVEQHRIGGPFESVYEEEVIAIFSKQEDAERYIEESRLVKVIRQSFAGERAYHSRSLLGACCHAWVEGHEEESIPVDPKFGGK